MVSIESESAGQPGHSSRQPSLAASRNAAGNGACRLVFAGSMQRANCREFELQVLDALRYCRRLELDLSGVDEVDAYGSHLLGLLSRVANREVVIVAASPAVAALAARLPAAFPGARNVEP